jgi:threonine dehydrogenase-like Zn-dependent dehydrogenase
VIEVQALTVQPGVKDSAEVGDVPEPSADDGDVLVDGLSVGICGTDAEIIGAQYGEAPPGRERLVLGHENLGRVTQAPQGCGLTAGDLVVGIVRRPDPVPCSSCAVGEWDMCRNGRYTERGIKGLDGYASQRYRLQPEFAVKLDANLAQVGVLLEPTTVVAKAWEQVERIGQRAHWEPQTVLVTGAGPIGLLAALLGVQRGLDVHVVDVVKDGPKPAMVKDLGATYHSDRVAELGLSPDIAIECTGVAEVVVDVIVHSGTDAVVCLTGVSSTGRSIPVDIGAVNRELVLQNDVIFGSVNANRRHYEQGAEALAKADLDWLQRLITRRVPLADFRSALQRKDDDIKVVLTVGE